MDLLKDNSPKKVGETPLCPPTPLPTHSYTAAHISPPQVTASSEVMSDDELARVLDRSATVKDDPKKKKSYRVVEQVSAEK